MLWIPLLHLPQIMWSSQVAAAVSCISMTPGSAGVKMGIWLTGKLGRTWYWCMGGAWHFGWASWTVHGAWHRCMVLHATSCLGGVPDGGLVKACVYKDWWSMRVKLWNKCSPTESVFEANTHCFQCKTGETGDINTATICKMGTHGIPIVALLLETKGCNQPLCWTALD